MNKSTLTADLLHRVLRSPAARKCRNAARRASCFLRGQKYIDHRGPQWQQLELPFSRTPVSRWNR